MADLPDIVGRIRIDTTDLESAVGRAAKSGSAMGSALGTAFGGLAATGLSSGLSAVTGFVGGSVDAFARLEDAVGVSGVLFGEQSSRIQEFAANANKSFGLSNAAALDAANTFATTGKAAGLSGTDLAAFSEKFVGLAGDLSSFKGTSPEQAIEAIGAAMRGETEPIRAYGVGIDDAALRNEALKQGLIATTKDALTPQQKALAASALIFAQTGDAQGDFADTSSSTANTQKQLANELENAQAALGGKLAPAITAAKTAFLGLVQGASGLIDKVGAIATAVQPVVAAITSGLKPAITATVEAIQTFVAAIPTPVLTGLGVVLGVVTAAIIAQTVATTALSVATGIGSAAKALFVTTTNLETGATTRGTVARLAHNVATVAGTVATVASTAARGIATAAQIAWTAATVVATGAATALRTAALLLNAAFLANPFVAVAALIALLVAGVVIAYKESETFRNVVDTAFQGIKKVVGEVVGFAIGVLKGLLTAWLTIAEGILGGAAKAFSWVPGVGPKLEQASAAFGVFKDQALGKLDDLQDGAKRIGDETPKKVAAGIDAGTPAARAAAARMSSAAGSSLRSLEGTGETVGRNAGQGLVDGLDAYAGRVAAAAQRLAISAGKAMASGLQERSPSRVTRRIGEYAGEGLALGLDSTTALVERSASALAEAATPNLGDNVDRAGLALGGARYATARLTATAGNAPVEPAGADLLAALLANTAAVEALRADVRRLPADYQTRTRTGAMG